MNIKYVVYALIVATMTAAGNYVLKVGVGKESWLPWSWMPPVNGYFLLGGGLFCLSLLVYLFLLKDLPLFVAQSMIAIQYIAVMFVACWGLHEQMDVSDIIGMGMIVFGIFLVA